MRLTPAEILQHLGFDISDDGIEINPNDAFMVTSALRLAGKTISTDQIPESELALLNRGIVGIVTGWSESGLIKPIENFQENASEENLLKLRLTLGAILKTTFKHRP